MMISKTRPTATRGQKNAATAAAQRTVSFFYAVLIVCSVPRTEVARPLHLQVRLQFFFSLVPVPFFFFVLVEGTVPLMLI